MFEIRSLTQLAKVWVCFFFLCLLKEPSALKPVACVPLMGFDASVVLISSQGGLCRLVPSAFAS